MAHEKIYQDPEIGTVTFRKSTRSSRVSIRVHPSKGVTVSVPMIMPYMAGEAFFKIKRAWIIETMARQKERYKDIPQASPDQVEQMRRAAKKDLPARLAELASR